MTVDFRILGPLEVVRDGALVDVGRPKQRALLTLLLLNRNRVVSVDRLAEDLWEGSPPADPAKALQPHVSRLRKALADDRPSGQSRLATHNPGYLLHVAPAELDAWRVERLVDEGRAALAEGRAEVAADKLSAAVAMWRGPTLADFAFAAFARSEITRLEELRLAAVEDLMEARLACGHHHQLTGDLEALVGQHPLRERLWGQRMVALYRCGRQADALRAYQELRHLLGEEVGIEPSPELKRLEESILLHRPQLEWAEDRGRAGGGRATSAGRRPRSGQAPERPLRRPDNLPVRRTTFIGRAAERAEVAARLAETRLLTLTGSGGCGKTRLAAEVAAEFDVADGVWLADLSVLSDGELVGDVVAAAVGVREVAAEPVIETLSNALGRKALLLVLDNCEQVLPACAALAATLLERCPRLRVLATSREALGVAGELAWRVPSLSLPDPGDPSYEAISASEAVQLFADRAGLAAAGFSLTPENAPTVALICRRLDGIALAIELAAARVSILSVQEIAARLDDCFRLLTGGSPSLPRQQTLEAAVAWSWDLLSPRERALLAGLSVFAGGFTLEAAEAVGSEAEPDGDGDGDGDGDVLDLLAQLHRKSLLLSDTTSAESRYRLLEIMRQYGRKRLDESGEAATVRRRHTAWCVALAERAEPELTGAHQASWLERLEAEHDNLRAAMQWSEASGEAGSALRLAGALSLFWRVRGHFSEGRAWLRRALAVNSGAPPNLRAKALWGEGFLAGMLGDYAGGIATVEESLALYRAAGDRQGCARSLLLLGSFRQFVDGPVVALPVLEESLALARQTADPWCLAHALALCGWVYMNRGDLARARPILEECLAVARPVKEEQSVAMGMHLLGWVALLQGDYGPAGTLLEEGLAAYRDLGESYGTASSLTLLGRLAFGRGEYQRGRVLLDQALALSRRMGSPGVTAYGLCLLGRLEQGEGNPIAARALFEEALAVTTEAGQPFRPALAGLGDVLRSLGDTAAARATLEDALAKATAGGDQLEVAQALHDLANLAQAEGDEGRAAELFGSALDVRAAVGSAPGIADSLDALAGLAVSSGRFERAARLLGAVESLRTARGYIRPSADRRRHHREVAGLRSEMTAEEFDAAWREGSAMTLDVAVALATG